MDVYEVLQKRRSIRKFKQKEIPGKYLEKMVDAARVAPSGANIQPCEFILVTGPGVKDRVFDCLKWAAYLAPEGTPAPDERPVAYIATVLNRNKRKSEGYQDSAAAIMSMIAVASSCGIGSCWLGAINRAKLSAVLQLPEYCELTDVIALGYPAEESVVEEFSGSVKYWKDEKGKMHVPKRSIDEIRSFDSYQLKK